MLTDQYAKLTEIVRSGKQIERAVRRLPVVERIVAKRDTHVHVLRRNIERLEKLSTSEKLLRERMASVEREAGQAALKAQELENANEALASIGAQIQALPETRYCETDEEKAERLSTIQARQQLIVQREAESKRYQESLDRMDAAFHAARGV